MRRVLARWQRSGLTLREFGEKRGIPLSTLSWWRRVFRRCWRGGWERRHQRRNRWCSPKCQAGEGSEDATVVEIVLPSGHVVRVPAGAESDTLRRVLQALQTTC